MLVRCPYCQRKIDMAGGKARRYEPNCPRCGERFVLEIQVYRRDEAPALVTAAADTVASQDATIVFSKGGDAADGFSLGSPRSEHPTMASGANMATGANGDASHGGADFSIADQSSPGDGEDVVSRPTDETTDLSGVPSGGSTSAAGPMKPQLGGYRLVEELGRGGMGAVFLAKQLSLDRKVALKTIHPQLASDPVFLSRFTREAYAAAQLTHHHVVQVYDMGTDQGIHFFSMEFVEGKSLDNLLSEKKRLDARTALTLTLQAARGLHFAHEHGMVHRDIKPANLLLSDHGIVKVADLGLVKTAEGGPQSSAADDSASIENPSIRSALSTKATQAGSAMGTPAFMAPEQADDAASVDLRADIYALGCTLYALLTGKPPFDGKTALEVISKHKTAPVVRPEQVARDVPKQASDITVRMVAKKPEERPQSMLEVIEAIEGLLNDASGGGGPAQRYGAAVEGAYAQYGAAPAAKIGKWALPAVHGLGALGATAAVAQGAFGPALAMLLLGPLATAGYVLQKGLFERSIAVVKLRELAFNCAWSDYGIGLMGTLAVAAAVWMTGLAPALGGVALVAALLGVAIYMVLDKKAAQQRAEPLQTLQNTVKRMRLEGMDEIQVRKFIATSGGPGWEELFEAVFGYEAKREMRRVLEQENPAGVGARHAGWRDKLVDAVDARVQGVRDAQQQRRLAKVESARLRAQGMSPKDAARQAAEEASKLVDHGAALRTSAREFASASADRRKALKGMLAASKRGEGRPRPSLLGRLGGLVNLVIGPRPRFAIGAALLGLGLVWANENGVFSAEGIAATLQQAGSGIAQGNGTQSIRDLVAAAKQQGTGAVMAAAAATASGPKAISFLPEPFASFLNGPHVALAGLLLLLTAPMSGPRTSLALGLAGAFALGGSLVLDPKLAEALIPLQNLGPIRPIDLATTGGAALIAAGTWWFRR